MRWNPFHPLQRAVRRGLSLSEQLDNVRQHAFEEGYFTAKVEIGRRLISDGQYREAVAILLPMKPNNPYGPTTDPKEK